MFFVSAIYQCQRCCHSYDDRSATDRSVSGTARNAAAVNVDRVDRRPCPTGAQKCCPCKGHRVSAYFSIPALTLLVV